MKWGEKNEAKPESQEVAFFLKNKMAIHAQQVALYKIERKWCTYTMINILRILYYDYFPISDL